jgi:hypothetical protein
MADPELAAMLSSLRLKEVLRDKSRSYMRISYKKYNEMCTELLTQRVMLDADSAVLEVLEDACLLTTESRMR